MGQKVNKMTFPNDFSRKIHCSLAHILTRNCPFCKKHVALIPYLVKKTSIFSKYGALTSFFFKFFVKNHLLSCTWLVKKPSILSKLHSVMGKKCQLYALFFRFLKNHCSHAHFLSKNVHCLKTNSSYIYILSNKNVQSFKNTVLSCRFFQNLS